MNPHRVRRSPSIAAAERAFEIARTHCTTCFPYHAIWPYLRLLGEQRGVDADRAVLMPLLSRLLAPGAKVLLAGSADAGVAELVLDAAGGRNLHLTVVDICDTPLVQCREISDLAPGTTVATRQASLSSEPGSGDADLVVAHSVLAFLDPDALQRAGAFLASSLVPGGHLLLTTGLSAGAVALDEEAFSRNTLAQLTERKLPLPCSREKFEGLLRGYAIARRDRRNPFADQRALLDWLRDLGLEPIATYAKPRGTAVLADGRIKPRSTPGAVVVARRQPTK